MTLGNLVLPRYKKITERKVELSSQVETLLGNLRKDIYRQKSVWAIQFDNLSREQATEIFNLYEQKQEQAFMIDELGVYTTVFMKIDSVDHKWRFGHTNFTLILEEC